MPLDIRSPAMKSFLIFVLLFLVYSTIIEYLIQHTPFVMPLQLLETNLVASTQAAFGVDAHAVNHSLIYPDKKLELVVGPLCTGIREMFLFLIVVLPFGALSLRKKLRSLAIFLPVIIAENITRLWLLYPLADSYGFKTMQLSHDLIWEYGQLAFLIALLFVWFYLFSGLRKSGLPAPSVSVKEKGHKGDK